MICNCYKQLTMLTSNSEGYRLRIIIGEWSEIVVEWASRLGGNRPSPLNRPGQGWVLNDRQQQVKLRRQQGGRGIIVYAALWSQASIFQQDNALGHKSKFTSNWLNKFGIKSEVNDLASK